MVSSLNGDVSLKQAHGVDGSILNIDNIHTNVSIDIDQYLVELLLLYARLPFKQRGNLAVSFMSRCRAHMTPFMF